jgi:hypothetical protein
MARKGQRRGRSFHADRADRVLARSPALVVIVIGGMMFLFGEGAVI